LRSSLIEHKEAVLPGLDATDTIISHESAEHIEPDMNDKLFIAIGASSLVGISEKYSPEDEVDELISSAFGEIELETADESPLTPLTLAVGGIIPGHLRLQTYVKNSDSSSRSRTLINVTYSEGGGEILTTVRVTMSGRDSAGEDGTIELADIFPNSHQGIITIIKTDVLRKAADRLWGAVIPALNKER